MKNDLMIINSNEEIIENQLDTILEIIEYLINLINSNKKFYF